jgi:hypothetical protein
MNTHSFSPNCGKKSSGFRPGAAIGAEGASDPDPDPDPDPEMIQNKRLLKNAVDR